jgi:hypothetical protein
MAGWMAAVCLPAEWPMLLNMLAGMALGMGIGLLLLPGFMLFFGALEVMLPGMLTAMLSGMLLGMVNAVPGVAALSPLWGALIGWGVVIMTYLMNAVLVGAKTS